MSGYIKRGGWVAAALAGCLMLAVSACAEAGQYKMTQGKDYAVCEAYKRTLNKLGNLREPLVCPNQLLDKTSGISRPAWRTIPFNFDLYLKLMALSASHMSQSSDYDPFKAEKPFDPSKHPQFVKQHQERISKFNYEMSVAEVDANSDGKLETILRLGRVEPDGCNWHGLFFVNPQLTDLDETPYFSTLPENTMNTYGHPITGAADILLYGGKVYFFQDGYANNFSFVKDPFGGRLPICTFEFIKGEQK